MSRTIGNLYPRTFSESLRGGLRNKILLFEIGRCIFPMCTTVRDNEKLLETDVFREFVKFVKVLDKQKTGITERRSL